VSMAELEKLVRRIIGALRFRTGRIFESPPVSELNFIQMIGNHGEFCRKLTLLGHATVSEQMKRHARYIGLCWFRLSLEHLEDARQSLAANRARATFSRSYYAAYNASKAVRYIVNGLVSLKGDDHPKASFDLPDDFPNVDRWSEVVTNLYEDRLRADYDNWDTTAAEHLLTAAASFNLASEFVDRCRLYLSAKLGDNI
jgi:HEPN domain